MFEKLVPQAPRRPQQEKVPLWLRWTLILFIIINIGAFIATTVITVISIDNVIAKLLAHNSVSDAVLKKLKQQEARRAQLLVHTTVEILMDVVDLFNVFFGSYATHVIYLAMKIISVGIWSYTTTSVAHNAMWIIPIGLTMLVAVVLLEWFAQLRKWALVGLILIGSVAWIAVVTHRLQQISDEISEAEDEITRVSRDDSPDGRQKKARLAERINDWKTSQQEIIIFSSVMVFLGTLSLFVLFIDCLCLGITVCVMQLLCIIIWAGKVMLSNHEPLGLYFNIPIAYSLLSCFVLFCHLAHTVLKGNKKTSEEEEKKTKTKEKKIKKKGKKVNT